MIEFCLIDAIQMKKTSEKNSNAVFEITDWMDEFPAWWRAKKDIIEFNTGMILPVMFTEKGIMVCQVVDRKEPRVLNFEEAHDKIRKVIFRNKYRDLYDNQQEKILKEHGFRIQK